MWNKIPKNEYHKGKPGTKKNPYSKDKVVIDKKSELGYSDGSPYNNDPFIDINTPNGMIDMSNTGRALMANGRYLQPYSGLHQFDTNVVREQPIAQYGGDPSIEDLNQMKKGGWLDGYDKQTKLKGDRGFTSKNIKTSINDLMMRNEMLFGPSGKKRYKPGLKYKDGGGLDTYQYAGSTYTPLSKSDSLVTDKTLHTAAFDTTKYGYEIEKTKPNKDDNVWKIDLQTGKKIAVPPYTWQSNKLAYQAAANKYAISQNKPITTPVFYTDFQYQQNNQTPIPASLQNKKLGGWLDQYQTGGGAGAIGASAKIISKSNKPVTMGYHGPVNKPANTVQDFEQFNKSINNKEVNTTEKTPQWIKDKNTNSQDKVDWWETFNYKNWGLNDYSNYSSFNSAFRNSRENKESEFMYKGNRYNTNLISKDQSDLYNESKQFLNNYYETQNYKPINFNDEGYWNSYMKEKTGTNWSEYYNSVKDSPEYNNYDMNNKKSEAIRDKLDALSSETYDFQTGKRIDHKLNNKEYEEYVKQKNKKIEVDNLNDKSYYFSITDQKPIYMQEDGYIEGKNKKIFLTTYQNRNGEKDKLNTTYVHELAHKADDATVYARIPKIDIDVINKHRSSYPTMSQENFEYLSDPSEIEARKMSLLFYNYKNKIDLTNFTNDDFQKYYEENHDKFPYDINQLFDLYALQKEDLLKYLKNDFSYLNNKKKYGGNSNNWLDQYQTAGQVPANSIFAPAPKPVTAPATTTPTSNLVVGTKGSFIKSNGSDNVWDQVKQQWVAPQNSSGMTFLDKPQSTAPKSKIPTKVEEMAPTNPSFNALTTKPVAESTGVVKPTVGSINQGMDAASMSKLAPFVEAERRRQEATAQVRYRNQQQRANGTAPGLYDENTQVANYLHQQDKQKETEDRAAVMMGGLALAPLALGIAGIPAVSTALATGFAAKGLYSIPNTYRNWVAAANPNSETTWEDALGTTAENAMDFMGSGEAFKIGKEALAASKESGVLSNAYKYNPWAFKPNPESYYRVIGENGYKDAIENNIIRPKLGSDHAIDYPTFKKGVPLDNRYASSNVEGLIGDNSIMVESNGNKMVQNRWAASAPDENVFIPRRTLTPNTEGVNFYQKDWLQGYKKIPKELPGSSNAFNSEIDWGKWNKEIPEDTQLMNEYHTIEQQTKANGTWMKNPDGSAFDGTPEMFVQENAKRHKEVYSEGIDITHRGESVFHPDVSKLGNDRVIFGVDNNFESQAQRYALNKNISPPDKILRFHPDIDIPENYAGDHGKTYSLMTPKQLPKLTGDAKINSWRNVDSPEVREYMRLQDEKKGLGFNSRLEDLNIAKKHNLNYAKDLMLDRVATDDVANYINKTNKPIAEVHNVFDGPALDGSNQPITVRMINPKVVYPKSRWYNNGKLDMTNPNMYKSLVPIVGAGAIGAGISQQQKYGGLIKKSAKKVVNYNQKSKFVNSQDSNWLDQYQKL